jgi:hypothetical protein
MSIKFEKIFVLFDSGTTNTKAIFKESWDSEKEIVTLTATKDDLTSLEKDNSLTSLSNVVYVGDQQEMHKRIAIDGGTSFSSDEFINLNKRMAQACSNAGITRDDTGVQFETSRRTNHKVKKINKLGLHFKQHPNVL